MQGTSVHVENPFLMQRQIIFVVHISCPQNIIGADQPSKSCIRDRFPSLFQIVVLGSLKFSYQSDHQVDISLSHMEAIALHSFKRNEFFNIISMCFESHKPCGFLDFKTNFISLEIYVIT